MAKQLFRNNVSTVLSGAINNVATSLSVQSGTGSKFPALTGGDYFLATIFEKDSTGTEINHEVVKCTAVSGDTLTISRDFESMASGGRAYPSSIVVNPSQVVYLEMRYTAYAANNTDFATNTHALTSKGTPVDADEFALLDSAASFVATKLTFANLKTAIKNYLSNIAFPIGETTPSSVKATTINASGTITAVNGMDSSQAISINGIATGSNSYLVWKTNLINLGIIGSEYSMFGVNTGNFGAYVYGTGDYFIATGGAKRQIIDTNGNMGLGVTPSAWGGGYKALNINRDLSLSSDISGAVHGTISVNAYNNGTNWLYKLSGSNSARYEQLGSIHTWYSAPSGTAGTTITFTQVLAVEKDKSLALQGSTSQTGTGITFPATQNPCSDPNTLDDYREATATLTATGMTTSPTGVASFVKSGNSVTLEIPTITGTSNATTFTLTGIPTSFRPTSTRNIIARVQDNTGAITTGLASIDTSGNINLFKDVAGTAFTASGTKSVNLTNLSYQI